MCAGVYGRSAAVHCRAAADHACGARRAAAGDAGHRGGVARHLRARVGRCAAGCVRQLRILADLGDQSAGAEGSCEAECSGELYLDEKSIAVVA